jgi:hypothetical protein
VGLNRALILVLEVDDNDGDDDDIFRGAIRLT